LRNQQTIMPYRSLLAFRPNPDNPDHHLWNNNGTWFVHYTIHPTAFTKERVRASLGTKSLREARRKRDRVLTGLKKTITLAIPQTWHCQKGFRTATEYVAKGGVRIAEPFPALRLDPGNPNHHLWNNHGTWWIRFKVYLADKTQEWVGLSLATPDVKEARRRRDALLRDQHQFSIEIEAIEKKRQKSRPIGQQMSYPRE
jgi:hypothetical protein